jgi:putative tryptophan/tyrosine transport system substrate-binding protein
MKRRDFLRTLTGATAALTPLAATAQQPRMPKIGLLLPYVEGEAQAQARVATFLTSLRERGWVDRKNVALEFRYSDGQLDRLHALVADLVAANVDIILTPGTEVTGIAQKATRRIPIVMVAIGDPIAAGFVASLARPGGNITGTHKPSRYRVERQTSTTVKRNFALPHPLSGLLGPCQCQHGKS